MLRSLHVHAFRNLKEIYLPIEKGIYVIAGENGAGKTSLLESIFLLSSLRSMRSCPIHEFIAWENHITNIKGCIEKNDLKSELSCELVKQGALSAKRLYINNHLFKSGLRYLDARFEQQGFFTVAFHPSEHFAFLSSVQDRRRFFNKIFNNLDSSYARIYSLYEKAHRHRNKLLKEPHIDHTLLETLNEQFILYALQLMQLRTELTEKLHQSFQCWLKRLRPNFNIYLRYICHHTETRTKGFQKKNYAAYLERLLPHEIRQRTSLLGPHLDSWQLYHPQKEDIASAASQGELKTLLLALKFAEAEAIEKTAHQKPLFLIDDLSSEIDFAHQKILINLLYETAEQTFITSTEPIAGTSFTFQMKQGQLYG